MDPVLVNTRLCELILIRIREARDGTIDILSTLPKSISCPLLCYLCRPWIVPDALIYTPGLTPSYGLTLIIENSSIGKEHLQTADALGIVLSNVRLESHTLRTIGVAVGEYADMNNHSCLFQLSIAALCGLSLTTRRFVFAGNTPIDPPTSHLYD